MMFKSILRVFAVLIALSGVVQTQAGEFVIGRYAGEFLELGAGARALAMGAAAVARPVPATAGYYNPSALAGLSRQHIEFMHASQFDNLFTYDYLSLARPMRNGSAGSLTLLYTRVGDIPLTKLADPSQPLSDENRVLVDKKTGDNELAVMASVGRATPSGWRVGATAKLLSKSVAEETAFGVGVDLGVGRTLAKDLDFGLAARNITTSILAWSTGRTEAILPSIAIGTAWGKALPAVNARVVLVADLEGHFESRGEAEQFEAGPLSANPHLGVEYIILETVALRGGYQGEYLTAGAGLNISSLSVNAAFQDHEDLGFTHRVSVGVAW
ncbi:PorV/PorQ family protein [bacterium]|nr:PorV/PorQ family protein [bacterium]